MFELKDYRKDSNLSIIGRRRNLKNESRVLKVAIFMVAVDFKYCAKERTRTGNTNHWTTDFFLLNDI